MHYTSIDALMAALLAAATTAPRHGTLMLRTAMDAVSENPASHRQLTSPLRNRIRALSVSYTHLTLPTS